MLNLSAEAASLWESLKPLLAVLGAGGVTIGGVVAVAWVAFRKWGEAWMSARFQRNLEDAKAEQAKEMEHLRYRINSTFDRVTRLHTREFEVLPDIWGKLVDAYSASSACLSILQQYAPVDHFTDTELEELFEKMEFTESEKESVLSATPRSRVFDDLVDFYRLREANAKLDTFNMTFRKLGLFVKPEIKTDLDKMFMIIREALFERQLNREYKEHGVRAERAKVDYFRATGRPLFEQLEKDISARLWDSTKS